MLFNPKEPTTTLVRWSQDDLLFFLLRETANKSCIVSAAKQRSRKGGMDKTGNYW